MSIAGEDANKYCDFTFVDGGHTWKVAENDMAHFAAMQPVGEIFLHLGL